MLEVEALLEKGEVERLLIVVYGPFASNPRDTWALSNDAAGASAVTIGATGLSLNALSDMAERSGWGVIMLAPGRAPQSLGAGLIAGLGEVTSVGDVTYLTGPADALSEVLTGGLLDAGKSLSAVAADMPDTVSAAGYVSPGASFMGAPETGAGTEMMQAGYWQAIRDVDTMAGYRLYLWAYPKSANRDVAEKRIAFLRGEPDRLARLAEEALTLSATARKGIQRDLKVLGHYEMGIDGQFGPGSRAAITAWQLEKIFDETGFMTGNEIFALREQAKVRQAAVAAEEDRARDDAWDAAKAGGTADHYRAFLRSYPSGRYTRQAESQLNVIQQA